MGASTERCVSTTVVVSTVTPRAGGGAFFTGQDSSGRWIRVKADYNHLSRPPQEGETWQLAGVIRHHEKYGDQLHVESCKPVTPTGLLLVKHLSTHPAYRGFGVGPVKIARLYKTYGNALGKIIDDSESALLMAVLSEDAAKKLIAAWHSNSQESSLFSFLNEYSIDLRLANIILKYWGAGAAEKLRDNPYRLMCAALTSWEKADRLALNLGVDPLSPVRLVAATEAWAYKRLDQYKDTLITHDDLKKGVRLLLRGVDEDTAERAIILALEEKGIVGMPAAGYQTLGCSLMERHLAERFSSIVTVFAPPQHSLFPNPNERSPIDESIDAIERKEGILLNAEQRRAVHMAMKCELSVLKGGAGVGKTTVLKAIHQAATQTDGAVFQMALAGRAAQRMREATGRDAYTIIGFLNQLYSDRLTIRAGDLVIVDESSMLDLMLTYKLIRRLPAGVRLLFVGDPYQLPPIGPGLIFHVLTDCSAVPSTELVEVHRQAASTGIPKIASQVRSGKVPDLPAYLGKSYGVSFTDCPDHLIMNHLLRIVEDLGGCNEAQILGVIKSGVSGVHKINQVFHNKVQSQKCHLIGWSVAETEPIIYKINNYERELFNGSLGHLEKVLPYSPTGHNNIPSSPRAIADFDGRKVALTTEDLGNIDLAYAITIHKAQGSQFNRVVIPITRSRLLDRTLIYTALTRGIEQVVFIGNQLAFNDAVINPPSAHLRKVGFSL